jgi:hypothetical protein
MSLLDEIKRDMKQGTPGPWHTSDLDAREFEALDGTAVGDAYGRDDEAFANASRCARVPDMEKALLAGLDADFISQVIRTVDGKNEMGAGQLAEHICAAIERAATE